MRKITAVILCLFLFLTVAGCRDNTEIIEHGEGILNIRVWEGGFGTKWLDNLIDAYVSENPEIKVNKYSSTLREQVANDLGADVGSQKYDLFFQDSGTAVKYASGYTGSIAGLNGQNALVSLNDVYNSTCEGENVSIKDKINDYFLDVYNYDDNYYLMNWGITSFGFTYNTSLINQSEIPYTTNELVALCQNLKGRGISPLIIFGDASYYQELFIDYWGQYQGADEFNKFFEGKAYDEESGTYIYSPDIFKQKGRLRSLEVIEELLKYDNGYVSTDSVAKSYQVSQKDYFQGTAAMMLNGGWLENEMSDLFPDGPQTVSGESFEIDIMNKPVISSLVEKLEYRSGENYMPDTMLSDIVAAIDGGAEEYQGVSEKDFMTIKTARTSSFIGGLYHAAVVPTSSNNVTLAKDFLKFMYSNKGIKAYCKAASGALLPVKDISIIDSSVTSDYSKLLMTNLNMLPSMSYYAQRLDYVFANMTNLDVLKCVSQKGYLEKLFASQNSKDRLTAQQIYDYDYSYYTSNNGTAWTLLLQNAGIIK